MSVQTLAALVFTIISSRSGQEVRFEPLIMDLVGHDVVFIGEEHDNTTVHQLQLEIIKALHARKSDLVISLEMFERDVQGILDDYLSGRVNEETFLEHARPWSSYKRHYRPIIEFAKAKGLEVIAANAPKKLTRRVSEGGLDSIDRMGHVARWISAPHDRYWDLFKRSMVDHPGEIKGATLERFYLAQCVKDDTMAESIHEFLGSHPHRQPLIVHLCGKFHSDYGQGTVSRLLARDPLCRTAVLTTESCKDPRKFELTDQGARAHYVLAVPLEPKKSKKEGEDAEQKPPHTAAVAEENPETKKKKSEKPAGDEEKGRAALGLMPSYEASDEIGVVVDAVTPGKGAEKAGIENGDVIIAIGGKSVANLDDYMDYMSDFRPGQKIKVKITRDGKKMEFEVKLGTYGR